jgi:glycosyltransferase involved in cell wall biosynthesis
VSPEVRDDLVKLGVAPPDRFEVIPLGFDLERFAPGTAQRARARAAIRSELGIDRGALVVTLIARLVPIKRVDRFLRACAQLLDLDARFLVVGDGELRAELVAGAGAVTLGERLIWAGFRRDIPDICFASDVVALTSDNEGTPVSLIEAQAAGLPVVGTDVGGVRSALRDGATGVLVAPNDESGFAAATAKLLDDRDLAARLARAGREHVRRSFNVERLVDDLDRLYRKLLTSVKRPPL